jgi:hypothetical protein
MEDTAAVASLPTCQRCEQAIATTALEFSFRGEPYMIGYYCPPCCDAAWREGIAYVDTKAAALAEAGIRGEQGGA